MADTRRKTLRPNPRGHQPEMRIFLLCLTLLLFFVVAGGSPAANAQNPPSTSFVPGPQFAIADFDGDIRPDLVSVQAEVNSSGNTGYWIQLQLSTVGRQSIRLVAPAGGLLIEARDVNGDHAVDLILATAGLRQPVAILLNDGHGGFSRVEPSAFPGAFRESRSNWGSVSDQPIDALGLPPNSRAEIYPTARGLRRGRSPTAWISSSRAELLATPFLASHAGRAPPSEIPYL